MLTENKMEKGYNIKLVKEKSGYRLNFSTDQNRIGILYRISAALYVQNWNIIELSATTKDGIVEDSFLIEPMEKRLPFILEYSLVSSIDRLLKSDFTVMNYVAKFPKKWNNLHSKNRKKSGKLDVEESGDGFVISIETEDRPGIIFEITQILYRLYFDIIDMESVTLDEERATDRLFVKRDAQKSSRYDGQVLKETLLQIVESED